MRNLDFQEIKLKVLKYSLKISGTTWDSEDLSQDVLIKVMNALETNPMRELTSAYLYRITLTTWLDKCKKDKVRIQSVDTLRDHPNYDEQFSTRELLEVLAHRLSPRAMVILLLMDVFNFTAKETAQFLSSAEGAVQVSLGRARSRLRKLSLENSIEPLDRRNLVDRSNAESPLKFDALVDAFRKRDPQAICRSYLGLAHQGVLISNVQANGEKFYFYFRDLDGNLIKVVS